MLKMNFSKHFSSGPDWENTRETHEKRCTILNKKLKLVAHTNFDGVKILNQVSYKKEREFSKMLNIHTFSDTPNRIQDTMFQKLI